MAQELLVSAADHSGGAFDQADNGVAQGRSLPRVGSDARVAEYGLCDFPIAGAVVASVGRLQHESQASTLLLGNASIFDRWAPAQCLPESGDGLDVSECVVAEWYERNDGGLWSCAGKEEKLDAARSMESVDPFRATALIAKAGDWWEG